MQFNSISIDELVKTITQQKKLVLNYCNLTMFDCNNLLELLRTNTQIKILSLDGNQLEDNIILQVAAISSLEELSLSENNVGDNGAQALANSQKLMTLYLNYNLLTHLGINFLTHSLSLTKLNLSQNTINDKAIEALAKAKRLKILYLDGCKLDDKKIKHLSENKILHELSLRLNKISNEGARYLARNTTLRLLDVSNNLIGNEGTRDFAQNENLGLLNINYNRVNDDGAIAFKDNQSLLLLQRVGNKISSNVDQELTNRIDANIARIEKARESYITIVIMFAIFKLRNNKNKLFCLADELLINILSYLNFPSFKQKQITRSSYDGAKFIFDNNRAIEQRLQITDWPGVLRLQENQTQGTGYFSFFVEANIKSTKKHENSREISEVAEKNLYSMT
ncbi:MAG: hypothetical protein K0S11_71 [Gammaproteobacteria bacterium]|jgi:Leucine-rich repeat (LRR) protein|nr:hypothetical protein [Gammaproteobacteria bacterium]